MQASTIQTKEPSTTTPNREIVRSTSLTIRQHVEQGASAGETGLNSLMLDELQVPPEIWADMSQKGVALELAKAFGVEPEASTGIRLRHGGGRTMLNLSGKPDVPMKVVEILLSEGQVGPGPACLFIAMCSPKKASKPLQMMLGVGIETKPLADEHKYALDIALTSHARHLRIRWKANDWQQFDEVLGSSPDALKPALAKEMLEFAFAHPGNGHKILATTLEAIDPFAEVEQCAGVVAQALAQMEQQSRNELIHAIGPDAFIPGAGCVFPKKPLVWQVVVDAANSESAMFRLVRHCPNSWPCLGMVLNKLLAFDGKADCLGRLLYELPRSPGLQALFETPPRPEELELLQRFMVKVWKAALDAGPQAFLGLSEKSLPPGDDLISDHIAYKTQFAMTELAKEKPELDPLEFITYAEHHGGLFIDMALALLMQRRDLAPHYRDRLIQAMRDHGRMLAGVINLFGD